MHRVISAIEISYYPLGAQVMTLVLPLGLFIVVMIVLYFVFSRPHTVPGHRPLSRGQAGRAGPGSSGTDRGRYWHAHCDRGRRHRATG